MPFEAKILADSLYCGSRLTTMQLTYPRFIHSEFMTHRQFSRNAASSRAIPVQRMIDAVMDDPVIPIHWGAAQKGMQAYEQIGETDRSLALCRMDHLRWDAIQCATYLNRLGLHKQVINRYLEPWMWITIIATATGNGWRNLFALRCHEAAEPHFQKIAGMALELYNSVTPRELQYGEWHLPLVGFEGDEQFSVGDQIRLSVARCARVSYLTHDGKRDPQADLDLYMRLRYSTPPHMSAFEHQAKADAAGGLTLSGNFERFWMQYRKTIKGECAE